MKNNLKHETLQILMREAHTLFHQSSTAQDIYQIGIEGFGATSNDTEIAADVLLREFFEEKLPNYSWVKSFQVEGGAEKKCNKNGDTLWIDPADGSQNIHYQVPGLGEGTLPFCMAISSMQETERPLTFGDCTVGIVADLRPKEKYKSFSFFINEEMDETYATLNDQWISTLKDTSIDPRKHIIFVDFYYPWDRVFASHIFPQKGGLRSLGCAVMEMMLVAAGSAAAFICLQQKCDILPVGYGMVKAAGGVGINLLTGTSLENEPIGALTDKIPVALCANQSIADNLMETIRSANVFNPDSPLMKEWNLTIENNRIIS